MSHAEDVLPAAHIEFRELPIFEQARNWRSYWTSAIRPFIGADVLEVGAGIGSATLALADARVDRWVCLEPDEQNHALLQLKKEERALPACCEIRRGCLSDIPGNETFDTIIYADVLEHIADDRLEISTAAARARSGGHLIVVAPAHQALYTEFDRAIGHYRRYSRRSLLALAPAGLQLAKAFYLDSAGMIASLGNRLMMHAAEPPPWSIRLWDSWFVPLSRLIDPLTGRRLGKTVVVVWRKL